MANGDRPGFDLSNPNLCLGHGIVFPRPDGAVARCGGPALCSECHRDQVKADAGVALRLTAAQIAERKARLVEVEPPLPVTCRSDEPWVDPWEPWGTGERVGDGLPVVAVLVGVVAVCLGVLAIAVLLASV